MAVSVSFKQKCPSCEALVPIKDASMVGKKIDCPNCKFRIVVEKPAANGVAKEAPAKKKAKPEEAPAGKADKTKEAVKAGKPKPEAPARAPAKEAVTAKAPAGAKAAAKTKHAPKTDDDEVIDEEAPAEPEAEEEAVEEEAEETPKKKKKAKAGSQKLMIGVGLAAVGLVVLGVAGYLLFGTKDNTNKRPAPGNMAGKPVVPPPGVDPNPNPDKKDDNSKKDNNTTTAQANDVVLPGAGPEVTNLLPPDSEHVLHVFFKNVFHPLSPVREGAFGPGAFVDEEFKQKLGIPALAVDDLVRAQRFSGPGWTFNVVHTTQPVQEAALVKALDLQPGKAIKGQKYLVSKGRVPWLDELGRLSFGAPSHLRALAGEAPKERPVFVRIHNPQTVIFADELPMLAFLNAEGQFKYQTDAPKTAPATDGKDTKPADGTNPTPPATAPTPPADSKDAQPMDKKPGETPMDKATQPGSEKPMAETPPPAARRGGTYMTVQPALKTMLDRMEAIPAKSKDRIFYSAATDMDAARLDPKDPEFRGRSFWQFRQVWDVSNLLEEKRIRIRVLGAALYRKATKTYRFRNELLCTDLAQAAEAKRTLSELGAPRVAQFVDRLLGHTVELPADEKKKEDPKQDPNTKPGFPPGPGRRPMPMVPVAPGVQPPDAKTEEAAEDDEPKASRIRVKQIDDETVDFTLDLVLDATAYGNLDRALTLLLFAAKNQLDIASRPSLRHSLGSAARDLGVKGLSERSVPPGTYPPGAFRRQSAGLRTALDPNQRLSWMAGLLPYLGRKDLYDRLDFNLSWKDPANWLAARSIVPEFIDPTYPLSSRHVSYPDLAIELAATHFVGIAGVGMDAASYPADDPAVDLKRGVLSYDVSRALKDVQVGHGAANTILLIQVPHDGPAGVTPWLAGGGSTLRGVPEKDSIAPFVLSTDRDGKPIMHKGKRGTYAGMVDGSVRFIDSKISDEVFKAMCTVKGPLPDTFKTGASEWAPIEPPPQAAAPKTAPAAEKKLPPPAPK